MDSNINWNLKGRIFDIQRFSVHDGDGIRTVVFLKGCSLRCKWCCNPESQNYNKELFFIKNTCINCGECIKVCPKKAITLKNNRIFIDRKVCDVCGICSEVCCSESLKVIGEDVTVKEVFDEVIKDKVFYDKSGGGITLSGGEALLQTEFAKEILKACKIYGINTTIETAGNIKTEMYEKVINYVDVFLYDLKVMDNEIHREYTGSDNYEILNNIKFLSDCGKNIIVRIPFIEPTNANLENIQKLIGFLKDTNIKEIHLLPYHKFGLNKYEYLNREYKGENLEKLSDININIIKEFIIYNGYKCVIRG
ncbi:MAG: glycyl-radical enzyme activating protein [Sarcina sp.]